MHLSQHAVRHNSIHQLRDQSMLNEWSVSPQGVQVMMLVPLGELDQATIHLVREANIEGLGVRAERQTTNLAEQVNLVRFPIVRKGVVYVDEIHRLGSCQEPPVRRELDTAYGAHPASKHSYRL